MGEKTTIKRIILTSLFAALTCVATMVIQIPTSTNGYLNLGDVFVLVSGIVLGPLYGTVSAGLGSSMADIFSGYLIYAPGTLIIKGMTALVASTIYGLLTGKKEKYKLIPVLSGSVAGEIVMVCGYLVYETILPGINFAAALLSVPGNTMQALAGIFLSFPVITLLKTAKITDKI